VATLAPDENRVKDQIKRIQDYVWAVYIDGSQSHEAIDENEALETLDAYYSEVGNRNSPDQVYLGILLFEKAFEDESTQGDRFERARKIFEFYRRVTGEDDWPAVEDRLEDIQAYFADGEGGETIDAATGAQPEAAVGETVATVDEAAPEAASEGSVAAQTAVETPAAAGTGGATAAGGAVVESVGTGGADAAAAPGSGAGVGVEESEADELSRREAEDVARRREAAEAFAAGLELVEGMCLVPAGTFLYGPEKREIFLDSFYIDLNPVTNAEYTRFVQEMNYRPPRFADDPRLNQPDQPVVGVSFGDAQQFAKWAGKELPTELQWEKAARGTDGRIYPWGNDPPGSSDATYGLDPVEGAPAPVGQSLRNVSPFGVRDMVGNVWEWTTAPFAKDSKFKAVRGGSYNDSADYLRTDYRLDAHPKDKFEAIGFRCVKNIHG